MSNFYSPVCDNCEGRGMVDRGLVIESCGQCKGTGMIGARKFHVTTVFVDGLSAVISNALGEDCADVFIKTVNRYKGEKILSITVIERKLEEF
jgi:hypothetical protein